MDQKEIRSALIALLKAQGDFQDAEKRADEARRASDQARQDLDQVMAVAAEAVKAADGLAVFKQGGEFRLAVLDVQGQVMFRPVADLERE